MLASPMSKADIKNWNDWALEEKFDGHRLIVQVGRGSKREVTAWTRPRKHAGDVSGKSMSEKVLPPHLLEALARLPVGIYDGELLGGDTSTDVTRTDLAHTLRFVVFDVLRFGEANHNVMTDSYDLRRVILERIFADLEGWSKTSVILAQSIRVTCEADVTKLVTKIWEEGGEGAILKRRSSTYQPGKRSRDCVKVKKCLTAVLTVVGFEPTRGKVLNRGKFATVILEDANGERTSVKTVNDAEIEAFNAQWDQRSSITTHQDDPSTAHPAIGRRLRIEYQDWTPKGGYRHPRWDRWEDE